METGAEEGCEAQAAEAIGMGLGAVSEICGDNGVDGGRGTDGSGGALANDKKGDGAVCGESGADGLEGMFEGGLAGGESNRSVGSSLTGCVVYGIWEGDGEENAEGGAVGGAEQGRGGEVAGMDMGEAVAVRLGLTGSRSAAAMWRAVFLLWWGFSMRLETGMRLIAGRRANASRVVA